MRLGFREVQAAALGPRLTVRHGAAGLLAAEGLLVAAWALLWAAFLLAVSPAPLRPELDGSGRPGASQAEASAQATPAGRGG